LIKSLNRSFETIYQLEEFLDISRDEIGEQQTLIQVFLGMVNKSLIFDIQNSIKFYYPEATLIGATTDGEIVDGEVYQSTISISITTFEKSFVRGLAFENRDSFISGQRIAERLITEHTKVLIIFSDGLYTNGEELLDGIASVNRNVIVAGGMAGDNGQFNETFVFGERDILTKGVIGVSISGEDLIAYNRHNFGWLPFGEKLTVTKSMNNIVMSIDDMLPTKIYEKYLGRDIANKLPLVGVEFPLIKVGGQENIARAILGKFDNGSLLFAGNLYEGDVVQIGIGDFDTIINLSKEGLRDYINHSVETTFIYSCMARRRFLKENIEIEIRPFNKISNNSGFFTNGEFFTIKNSFGNSYELLNESMTLLSLAEEGDSIVKRVDIEGELEVFDKSLSNTTKAISHLTNVVLKEIEKEVKDKEELNQKLERDIEIEIEKNHEKDELLLTQYKLAKIGELMGMIAHQWRQPLASISAITSSVKLKLALQKFNLDTESEKDNFIEYIYDNIAKVDKSIDFLSNTIDDFRKFYKDSSEIESINLYELIKHTLSLVDGTKVEFKLDCARELEIAGHSNQLIQVFLNIIKNSTDVFRERSDIKGEISFRCYKNSGSIYIEISDNGGGIDKELLPRIFEKNFSTKLAKDGTGLGLYMSKLIVEERCRGELSVANIDNGAKFTIKIPDKNGEN
jgi:signal transduction histidine kinase